MLLSELIKRRRMEMGLSQAALARKGDVYQRTVSDLERGMVRRPNLKTLRALARAVELPMEELVLAAGQADSAEGAKHLVEELENAEGDPVMEAILWGARHLDEEGKRMVLDQVNLVRRWQESVDRKLGG